MEGFKVLTYSVLLVWTVGIAAALVPVPNVVTCGGVEAKLYVDKVVDKLVILTKGTNANLTIVFTPDENSSTSQSVCHGEIAGRNIPFPVDKNGCDTMTPSCPLMKGKPYTFKTSIAVHKIYPTLKLAIKWEEINPTTKKDILCLIIPAEIR